MDKNNNTSIITSKDREAIRETIDNVIPVFALFLLYALYKEVKKDVGESVSKEGNISDYN